MNRKVVRVSLPLVLAALVILAAGCGSGAPATPTPTATSTAGATWGAPTLAFDKLQVDLGTVTRDQLGIQTFLVMNRGEGPLQIGPVEIQVEQGCTIAEAVDGVVRLQIGEMALLPIKIGRHQEIGPHRLLVSVSSNDPAMPVATLSVRFNVIEEPPAGGTGPRLRVDKEMIDIGTVPNEWPLYEQFTLRNQGNETLVLDGVPQVRVEEGC